MDLTLARQYEAKLLETISASLAELERLLEDCSDYEDRLYRFYHQSFKVYHLQHSTLQIVARLEALAPDRPLNAWFMDIVRDGTGKQFSPSANANWPAATRPILEAFFHARYFLEMVCKYGKALTSPPEMLPSGWAAVLYLYGIR